LCHLEEGDRIPSLWPVTGEGRRGGERRRGRQGVLLYPRKGGPSTPLSESQRGRVKTGIARGKKKAKGERASTSLIPFLTPGRRKEGGKFFICSKIWWGGGGGKKEGDQE